MGAVRLAIGQINPIVGDLAGNAERMGALVERAKRAEADLILFPELALTGYPPEDLIFRPRFLADGEAWLQTLARRCRGIHALVGCIERDGDLYNAAAVLSDGQVQAYYRKQLLPNYGVFDERRYFRPGTESLVLTIGGARLGVTICEDIWYPGGPTEAAVLAGDAEVIANISSSPYHRGKSAARDRMLASRAADYTAAVVFCNTVGGQDELVFDGNSRAMDERGNTIARAAAFAEDFCVVHIDPERIWQRRWLDPRWRSGPGQPIGACCPCRDQAAGSVSRQVRTLSLAPAAASGEGPAGSGSVQVMEPPAGAELPHGIGAAPREAVAADPEAAELYAAVVLGLGDYVRKNGFQRVVLGLSGGIDSSLTACLAADALGQKNVVGILLPSQFSSAGSLTDARSLAEGLGIEHHVLPIEPLYRAYEKALEPFFRDLPFGLAEENLQARIRGNIWMAFSNKFGWLLLATGNKSEMSVGYGTLYGDMAGAFAPLKDLTKTMVYRLSRYRNQWPDGPIPESALTKPPSAELRPDQKDSDSLPPYEVLDPILEAFVEEDAPAEALVRRGFPKEHVERAAALVFKSEYKRRQAPPGVKVTPRALGRDRRYPMTNRFVETVG